MKTKTLQIALAACAVVLALACTSKTKHEGTADSDSMMMNSDTSGAMMNNKPMNTDSAMKDTMDSKMGDTTKMAPKP